MPPASKLQPKSCGPKALVIDTSWVRSQFPALNNRNTPHPEVFLDSPGGTQVPQRVIDAISDYLKNSNSNMHGAFRTSRESDLIIEKAHSAVADLLGCSENEVIFGPNMTTLTYMLSRTLSRQFSPGDEIVVTRLDHDANFTPWKALSEQGLRIREVQFNTETGTLDLDDFYSKLSNHTKLVAFGYASNAIGTINNVRALTAAAHQVGAYVFIDAVHFAPHGLIDVREIDCDFLACSAYKFFGPHQGLLFGKAEILSELEAYKLRPVNNEIPWCFETGTQNHECMAGVTASIDYLAELGSRCCESSKNNSRRYNLVTAMQAIQTHERKLAQSLIGGMLQIKGLSFYGIRNESQFEQRTPTVACRLQGKTPGQTAKWLGDRGFYVWDGNFYAINVTEALGVEEDGGLVRIGLVHYNTEHEVERLLNVLDLLQQQSRKT